MSDFIRICFRQCHAGCWDLDIIRMYLCQGHLGRSWMVRSNDSVCLGKHLHRVTRRVSSTALLFVFFLFIQSTAWASLSGCKLCQGRSTREAFSDKAEESRLNDYVCLGTPSPNPPSHFNCYTILCIFSSLPKGPSEFTRMYLRQSLEGGDYYVLESWSARVNQLCSFRQTPAIEPSAVFILLYHCGSFFFSL